MTKLLIHIGRHKTGTSSLQQFLFSENAYLREKGYNYVNPGQRGIIAHHYYSEKMQGQKFKEISQEKSLKNLKVHFSPLLNAMDQDRVNIISSEAFQNCDPELVKVLFESCEVKIICYIRNEIEYLASSYCQRIQATDYIHDFNQFKDKWNCKYRVFLNSWKKAFGLNFYVEILDRETLFKNSIVPDFCKRFLNIFPEDHRCLVKDANPSLTAKLLAIKRELNKRYGKRIINKKIYGLFNTLSVDPEFSGKFRIPCSTKSELINKFSKSHSEWALPFFGVPQVFDYDKVKCSSKAISITADEIDEFAKRYEIEKLLI